MSELTWPGCTWRYNFLPPLCQWLTGFLVQVMMATISVAIVALAEKEGPSGESAKIYGVVSPREEYRL